VMVAGIELEIDSEVKVGRMGEDDERPRRELRDERQHEVKLGLVQLRTEHFEAARTRLEYDMAHDNRMV